MLYMPPDYDETLKRNAWLGGYQLMLQQINHLLSFRIAPSVGGVVQLPPNPNRVLLAVGVYGGPPTSAAFAIVQFMDTGGNIIWEHTVYEKEADVAAVTPSPIAYAPFRETVLTFGPLLQSAVKITQSNMNAINMFEGIMAGLPSP